MSILGAGLACIIVALFLIGVLMGDDAAFDCQHLDAKPEYVRDRGPNGATWTIRRHVCTNCNATVAMNYATKRWERV